jgi:hypothetical protein
VVRGGVPGRVRVIALIEGVPITTIDGPSVL